MASPSAPAYDKIQAYELSLASSLAYVDFHGLEKDADGYIDLSEAIRSGRLNLNEAIRNANITFDPNGGGVESLANKIRDAVAGDDKTGNSAWRVKVLDADGGKHQALVIKHDDQVIASFRGTQFFHADQWEEDFNAEHTNFKEAYSRYCGYAGIAESPVPHDASVHEGFIHALNGNDENGLAVQVERETKAALGDGKKLFICGHSLGAALAEGYAAQTGHDVEALYTYGSPKLGNKEFKAFLDNEKLPGKYVRFTANYNGHPDIVSTVPPSWMEYEHAGQEVRFPEDRTDVSKLRQFEAHIKERLRGRGVDPDCQDSGVATEWHKEIKQVMHEVHEVEGRVMGGLKSMMSPMFNHQPYLYAEGLSPDRAQGADRGR